MLVRPEAGAAAARQVLYPGGGHPAGPAGPGVRYRDRFAIPFVQVTGSVGKTTTKEMLAAVLGAKLRVLKTPENFNNDIGTPLTLLGLGPEHQAAVIETGMNHFGDPLFGEMVRPDIAVISNIGDAHIEHLAAGRGSSRPRARFLRT